MTAINNINAQELSKWLESGEAVLVDVREPAEYRAESIQDSRNLPLSDVTVDAAHLPEHRNKKLVIHCKSGRRSMMACEQLKSENAPFDVWNLEGGIDAWKSAGMPIASSGENIMPLDRQVQTTLGILILTGLAIGHFVSPYGLILTLIIGLGLTNAGLTGWCGLAKLIAKMPCNK